MTLSEELAWRGLIKDTTFSDKTWLDQPKTFYYGVDGSSDSMTIGNLAAVLLARRLTQAGWKAVLLVGGATSLIGDPGGKNEERPLLPKETIAGNVTAIAKQLEQLFDGLPFVAVNNLDWFKDVTFIDFLRDFGKHYSMTELVQREFIAERIGEHGAGISFAEFSYTMIQGYDYWQLCQKFPDLHLQVGGSDQWGNMLSGVQLLRKKENKEVHALSMPLVVDKTTGRKFGKSEAGAIWLDPIKTSPYSFYQFWLNTDDSNVIDYLKIYTFLQPEEIAQLGSQLEHAPHERRAHKVLGYEVTKIVHGQQVADSVARVTEVLFGGQDYADLQEADLTLLKKELPTVEARLSVTPLVDILVQTGLAQSNSEARRFLQENAVYINGTQFSLNKNVLYAEDVIAGHVIIRRGKNNNAIVEVID